jgi:hypothetical protein
MTKMAFSNIVIGLIAGAAVFPASAASKPAFSRRA